MSCTSFIPNPLNVNDICRYCFQHRDTHPAVEPYSQERMYRMKIENILYDSDTKEQSAEVDTYLFKLLHKPPPPEEYFKVFNVYSYVRQNLTNPEFSELHPMEKLAAIYEGVDLLLLVALPLRRPPEFEKVAKLRKREPHLLRAEKLEGTHDVIRKLGYTVTTPDHYEFPHEINTPPDQTLIREVVADLQIALEEIKLYSYNTHPCPERFAEGADWAKKTTPLLPEIKINKDIKDFDKLMDNVLGVAPATHAPQPYPAMPRPDPTASQLNSTVAPLNPTMPSMNITQPQMNPTVAPMNLTQSQMNPTVAPMNLIQSQMNPTVAPLNPTMPMNPTVAPINPSLGPINPSVGPIRPGRSRLDTYKDIPPPIPEGMMHCPKENCRKLIPKKSFVCPECRLYLSSNENVVSEASTLIPIEEWICINCTLINTTAKGRSRVCTMCETTNPIEMSPTTSVEQSTHKYSESEETKLPLTHPRIQPNRSQDKPSFDQDPESPYTPRDQFPQRNPSISAPKNPSMNPQNNLSMNLPKNSSMNPQDSPADYRSLNPNFPPMNPPGDHHYHQTMAPKGDWNPQDYPPYQNMPANPQLEYPGYARQDQPVQPQMHGQLDTSIYGPPYQRMEDSYIQRNHPRTMHEGENARAMHFPPQPAMDPKEHYPLLRNSSHAGFDASLGPRKGPIAQYPGPYVPPPDMGYPPQLQGDRMPGGHAMFHNQKSTPLSSMMPCPSIAPHKYIKHIIVQNYGFKDEALQLAIQKFGVHNCLDWLNKQFNNNIKILTEDVRKFDLCQTVTSKTIEETYIACHGVVPNVPPKIQDNRRQKLAELMDTFQVNKELAITALEDKNWEVSAALEHIILLQNQQQLDNCRPYLWTGGMTIPERQPDEIDKEIWEQLELLAKNPAEMNDKISRKFLSELKIPTFIQLNLLLHLMIDDETKGKEPKDLLQAAQEVSDYDGAFKFLNQQCHICTEDYTANEMIQMFYCNHMFCKNCVKANLEHIVRNAAIKRWTCPECGEPDIQQMEDPSEYFGLLSTVVQALCEHEVTDLYHQKLNEFAISKRPEFRWCPHCHSGFLGQEGVKKLRCPQEECNQYLCYICKRKWEPEHEGRSCEEYQQWREVNDRDILDKGLAAKLVEEGIECPSCKFKYELARGGCMHFRCTQCPAEFCSGCFQLFKKENCTKFASCARKGLHAHHPRNCQYFTRDMEIVKMKELLEKGGFQRDEAVVPEPAPEPAPEGAQANPGLRKRPQIYKVKVPDEHRKAVIEEMTVKMGDQFQEPPQGELKIPCQIVEYKDNPDGDFDKENCSKSSLEKDGYAGLCDKHYKEYLCGLITKAGSDPIDVLEVTEDTIFELFAILKRNEIPYDEKMKGDQLKLLIKDKLPLNPIDFSGALQA